MEENTAIEANQKTYPVPIGSVVFKSVIALFFCIALASYLFGYLFDAMMNMIKSTDFVLSIRAAANPNTLKVQFSIIMGLLFALPFVSTYYLSYKSPGFYVSHKRRFFLLSTVALLISMTGAGVLVFIFFPVLLDFFPKNAIAFPGIDYISNIFPLVIGIGFFVELPVITYIINKAGFFGKIKPLLSIRHIMVFALVIGALVTPPDPVSMIFMAMIFIFLYEISAVTTRLV